MSKCCSPKTALIIRVVYAGLGVVVGIIICAVFNVAFDNKLVDMRVGGILAQPDPDMMVFLFLCVMLQTCCFPGLGVWSICCCVSRAVHLPVCAGRSPAAAPSPASAVPVWCQRSAGD